MPSPKKSQSNFSKGTVHPETDAVGNPDGREEMQDERIMAGRADLLRSRQVDLDKLMLRHDDLVREAFHLDKFVTLLGYDPKIARQDNSQVFVEYQASHDLIAKSAASVASGSTPRKTRRATTELRVSLAATISVAASSPPSILSPSPAKMKEKFKVASRTPAFSPGMKGVGKFKSPAKPLAVFDRPSILKGKGKATEVTNLHASKPATEGMFPPPLSSSTRGSHPRRAKDSLVSSALDNLTTSISSISSVPPSLKRKRPSFSALRSDQKDTHRSAIGDKIGDSLFPESELLPQPKPSIKRIRLIQRPPPAVYTHPSQVPPEPQYGSSVQGYLQSYSSLEDGISMPEENLEQTSFVEAKTRARIRELKREGRLMLNISDLPDILDGTSRFSAPEADRVEPMRRDDYYDHLVSAATHRARLVSAEYAMKKNNAKKVAKLAMAWHGNREGTEEKQRKAEAVRMRTLAKVTAKEVEKQWKRAVMAVREQNRALLEAEEVRRGRKHLDAILDQSGVILEAQHTDLSRARSRSSSARDLSESDASDSGLETDIEGSEDDSEAHADVSLLLGRDVQSPVGSRGPSSEVDFESVTHEIDTVLLSAPSLRGSPGSTSSVSTPVFKEAIGLSLSTPSSEICMADGSETVPPEFPLHDPDGEQEVLSREHLSELSDSTVGLVTTEVVNVSSSRGMPRGTDSRNSRSESLPRTMSGRQSPLTLHPSDDLSRFHPTSLEPRLTPPPDIPESSVSMPASNFDFISPFTTQGGNVMQPNGHQSVAIRLSNGIVIYRDEEAPSMLDEVELTADCSQAPDGHQAHSDVDDVHEKRQSSSSGAATSTQSIAPADIIHNTEIPLQLSEEKDGWINDAVADVGMDRTNLASATVPMENGFVTKHQVEPVATTIATSPDAGGVNGELPVAPHLVDFAATPVDWDPNSKITAPFLLRGNLRPYQQSGLEWLASLHTNNLNGILADEMGLGKTIQTIALLAHLACDRGIWGPHLIVVPTSVLLNWEMEFKKFLPGFKILPYHGSTKRRKELRVGWNSKHAFNVCVTSYTLASRDAHIFKRKAWYYMILDEAHMIKNFKSQRWNILLMFRSFRRLLLTGTPLQNNLTELWALLQFLMSGTNFANLKEFGDWFSNPLEKAIEQGTVLDEETQERVRKLHTVLRPYLLRRLKADVEKELPSKFEHLVICRLSKRQRFLYDEFMSRAQTQDALASGAYHKVANILMQLRKVCNHPDLFEVRPIVTSFAMPRSAMADFEIKDLLIRRRFLENQGDKLNLDFLGLVFIQHQGRSMIQARSTRSLDASSCLPFVAELPGEPPPNDTRSIEGFKRHAAFQRQLAIIRQWTQISYTNRFRCAASPLYGSETISVIRRLYTPLVPLSEVNFRSPKHLDISSIIPTFVKSYLQREEDFGDCINLFAFMTPPVVARDMSSLTFSRMESQILHAQRLRPDLDAILHRTSVKLQIAFPDASLVQYDCGKLQELASLLRIREAGGHRVLIFTQMTKVLDILEIFLNFHGYRYLRLDGATKIEDRQYITERFNTDARVFAFIASSRSGGVGINLTGADTVIFYDSDFNPQMDRQCEDRAHRIGQIRDVHIYRFISEHTVEESMLRKANQKRSLDNIVIQQGEFDWRSLLIDDEAFGKALGEFEDKEDAYAARVAAREEAVKEVEDQADFAAEADDGPSLEAEVSVATAAEEEQSEEEGTVADYMLAFVSREWDWFSTWRL